MGGEGRLVGAASRRDCALSLSCRAAQAIPETARAGPGGAGRCARRGAHPRSACPPGKLRVSLGRGCSGGGNLQHAVRSSRAPARPPVPPGHPLNDPTPPPSGSSRSVSLPPPLTAAPHSARPTCATNGAHPPYRHLLEASQVPVQVLLQRRRAQVQDGIHHQLAGAVVGHLSAGAGCTAGRPGRVGRGRRAGVSHPGAAKCGPYILAPSPNTLHINCPCPSIPPHPTPRTPHLAATLRPVQRQRRRRWVKPQVPLRGPRPKSVHRGVLQQQQRAQGGRY